MLTTDQKEKILRLAGVAVPDYPGPDAAIHVSPHDLASDHLSPMGASAKAAATWAQTIDTLFVQYTAERAARSLREAERARQDQALRNAQSGQPR